MALDKQRILNELGSVVNQLQSADCGCMGKLFSNQSGGEGGTATTNPQPSGGCRGCMHGGCCRGHGGYNHGHAPGAGEPFASSGPCTGCCNPSRAFAETYSYLNQNLMQPVVKEVYNDMKSITPQNTLFNNRMAGKVGLSPQEGPMQGGNSMQGENPMQGENYMQGGHPMMRGHPVQGGNLMPGGNPMQEENPMQGRDPMQVGYSTYDGIPGQGDMGMPQNKLMGSCMGNQMQRTINDNTEMLQHEMQGNAMGYQIQDSTGLPRNQMQESGMSQGMSMNKISNQKIAQMTGGMGPQIVNMMKQNSSGKPMGSLFQKSQMPDTMLINAPQSPHGTVGVTPLNTTGGINQGQYKANAGMTNTPNQQKYDTQYMNNPNMTSGFNPNAQNYNTSNANMQQSAENPSAPGNNNYNPAAQRMGSTNQNYGQHTQGMSKFNEMFPGIMKGESGELGFDPMAIAIQMNPENQKMSAINAMQRMLGNSARMQNSGANDAAGYSAQRNTAPNNQQSIPQSNQQQPYGQPGSAATPVTQNQQYGGITNASITSAQPNQVPQQVYNANQVPQQQVYNANEVPQHQIYSATGVPATNQGPPPQQIENQQQQIDPNTGAPMPYTLPPGNQVALADVNVHKQQPAVDSTPEMGQIMIQEPIFPVDNSRFHPNYHTIRRTKYYQYNTLGQPIEVLPAGLNKSLRETSVPQTLSPEPWSGKLRKDIARFNVKPTVSKTSLMANKPVGRTPSRSQLQNIYNQYKGSNSYTQQNVRVPDNGASFSEGKIGVVQRGNENRMHPVAVERVAGDTAANNQTTLNQVSVKGQPMQHIGDVPASNKPHGDVIPAQEPPMVQGKLRNGLQDMIYTSYPSSAAWTFHGDSRQQGLRTYNHRFRNRD